MTRTQTAEAVQGQVRDRITSILTGIFDTLHPLKTHMEMLFAESSPTAAEVASLDPWAIAALQREDDLIVGAGFVAAPGAVSDSDYWLQWWSDYNTPRSRQPERLVVEVDPHSESFNDYTRLPWYAVPAQSRRRHLAGPYVDYLCTDEYTLTATIPILVGDRFVGVVGADVYANNLAQVIGPLLQPIAVTGRTPYVVNESGRVLVADHPTLTTGDLVGVTGSGEALADLPFALVAD